MSTIEDRQYKDFDLNRVIRIAEHPEWHLDKAHAIYELACRSLEDPALLPAAWRCIGSEITYVTRQGPPLGQGGAVILLDRGDQQSERIMVECMNDWTAQQQADFFLGLVPKEDRKSFVNRLSTDYSFVPKVKIDDHGEICFEGC